MSNPYRGEVAVMLGGVDYVLRPSFKAMVDIETLTGSGLVPLTRKFLAREYGAGEVAAVLVAGINASRESGRPPVKVQDIGPLIFDAGLIAVAGPVLEFLTGCLSGGKGPGEPEAEEGQTASPSAA